MQYCVNYVRLNGETTIRKMSGKKLINFLQEISQCSEETSDRIISLNFTAYTPVKLIKGMELPC